MKRLRLRRRLFQIWGRLAWCRSDRWVNRAYRRTSKQQTSNRLKILKGAPMKYTTKRDEELALTGCGWARNGVNRWFVGHCGIVSAQSTYLVTQMCAEMMRRNTAGMRYCPHCGRIVVVIVDATLMRAGEAEALAVNPVTPAILRRPQ